LSGSFDRRGNPVWDQGLIVTCFGKKRSGKSVMGRVLFDSFPYDRVVISANRDDGPFTDPHSDVFDLRGTVDTLPDDWPEDLRRDGRRMTLRYEPDPGSPTCLEDCDAVLGMVRKHQHAAILVHEVAFIAPSGRVPAHMRRLLHANRHDHVSLILCGPRPITVDPLVLAQSDLVYVFEMQVPEDLDRVAKSVGWKPTEFAESVEDLGPHEYLRFDANENKPAGDEPDRRLVHCDALPEDVMKHAQR
jgi:hypothetical protein